MTRFSLLALIALLATPGFALEEGTYPFRTETGGGEITVARDRVRINVTGPDECSGFGAGPLLRGEDGVWAAFFSSLGQECVVLGDATSLREVGEGCREFSRHSCPFEGQLQFVPADSAQDQVSSLATTIRVAPAMLKWRFDRLGRSDRQAVQRRLAELDLYTSGIDGAYGPGTEAGLIGYIQGMADRGETVDPLSVTFINEVLARIATEGRAITAPEPSPQPTRSDGPIYVGTWNCSGFTVQFSEDQYRFIDVRDGSVEQEGRLRPDLVDGNDAYLELIGHGNLAFFGVGTPEMIVHNPVNAETWDCRPG